jgi:hypothetical protein
METLIKSKKPLLSEEQLLKNQILTHLNSGSYRVYSLEDLNHRLHHFKKLEKQSEKDNKFLRKIKQLPIISLITKDNNGCVYSGINTGVPLSQAILQTRHLDLYNPVDLNNPNQKYLFEHQGVTIHNFKETYDSFTNRLSKRFGFAEKTLFEILKPLAKSPHDIFNWTRESLQVVDSIQLPDEIILDHNEISTNPDKNTGIIHNLGKIVKIGKKNKRVKDRIESLNAKMLASYINEENKIHITRKVLSDIPKILDLSKKIIGKNLQKSKEEKDYIHNFLLNLMQKIPISKIKKETMDTIYEKNFSIRRNKTLSPTKAAYVYQRVNDSKKYFDEKIEPIFLKNNLKLLLPKRREAIKDLVMNLSLLKSPYIFNEKNELKENLYDTVFDYIYAAEHIKIPDNLTPKKAISIYEKAKNDLGTTLVNLDKKICKKYSTEKSDERKQDLENYTMALMKKSKNVNMKVLEFMYRQNKNYFSEIKKKKPDFDKIYQNYLASYLWLVGKYFCKKHNNSNGLLKSQLQKLCQQEMKNGFGFDDVNIAFQKVYLQKAKLAKTSSQ